MPIRPKVCGSDDGVRDRVTFGTGADGGALIAASGRSEFGLRSLSSWKNVGLFVPLRFRIRGILQRSNRLPI